MQTFYQYGNIKALVQGVYGSDFTIAVLSKKGDLGLGAFNGGDGEMIALNGVFYRISQATEATCDYFLDLVC